MRTLLGLILGLFAGYAPAQDVLRSPLKVMSFNIRYGTAEDGSNAWEHRKDLVFRTIRQFDPDVIGLQEALRFQLDDLAAEFPDYAEIGVGRDDGKEAGEYSALLVRHRRLETVTSGTYWFSDIPEEPGSKSWGNNIPRICTWARLGDRTTQDMFVVFNVHWDHESQPAREKSADMVLEGIRHLTDEGEAVVVMGDFNAGGRNLAFRRLLTDKRVRLRDTFRDKHPTANGVGTFHGFTGRSSGDRIDAILVSEEWAVSGAEILRDHADGRYPSDHFPVTAILVRTARQETGQ